MNILMDGALPRTMRGMNILMDGALPRTMRGMNILVDGALPRTLLNSIFFNPSNNAGVHVQKTNRAFNYERYTRHS